MMKFQRWMLATALAFGPLAQSQATDAYKVDAAHAHIGFSISHMVISKVRGNFDSFDATLHLEEGRLTQTAATIKTTSVNTANEKRDEHLRNTDFFDVATHPEIKFESTKIAQEGSNGAITGKLTINGVTKEVILPFSLKGPIQDPWGATRVGLEASTTIDRTDYGLTWSKAMETGGLLVGNEVEIVIDLEFVKQ